MNEKIIIYFDGSSIGNPGPSAAAYIIEKENGEVLFEEGIFIGESTNNVSEYKALIYALNKAKEMSIKEIELRTDSELVINHLLGKYRVKSDKIIPLFKEAKELLKNFKWEIKKVSRKEMKKVDQLAFATAKSGR
ncbi:MAG: ribonuclease HI family protein [candidate division WOR-3 bacterium]